MRMETVDGELRPSAETAEEIKQVETIVRARTGATMTALLSDLRPVLVKHGLNADDAEFLTAARLLIRERLWWLASEEVLLGGRY